MPFPEAAPFLAHHPAAGAGSSGRVIGGGALASAAFVAAAATEAAAASVAALGNGGGGAEASAPGGRGAEEQGQVGGRAGDKVGASAASARFAELPTVRPETQDETDLAINGMAMSAATGFESEAFWPQAAVLYNEEAMAAADRSVEDGSAPKAYRGPTTAGELEAWFEKASAFAAATRGGGAPPKNPVQHGTAGRAAEDGPVVNAMGLVSGENMQAWFERMAAESAINQQDVPPQVRPKRPRLLGRRSLAVAAPPAATRGLSREGTGRDARHVLDGCRESSQ